MQARSGCRRGVSDMAKRPIIYLDAGHDPDHPGNVNRGLRECDSTMSLAERTAHYIRLFSKEGNINSPYRVDVVLSRTGLDHPSIDTRTFRANYMHASLLLSIHTNSVINPLARGAEAWISAAGAFTAASRTLSEAILEGLVTELGVKNRGVHLDTENRLGHLGIVDGVNLRMPAVLIEPCFASNPTERGWLLDPRWRERCARVLAKACVAAMGMKPRVDLLR